MDTDEEMDRYVYSDDFESDVDTDVEDNDELADSVPR